MAAYRKSRQHRELCESARADRTGALARYPGGLLSDRASASGWDLESALRTALPGPLRSPRLAFFRPQQRSFYEAKQRKGNCPLPLQPHPQNQPHGFHEATTLIPIPDISLATKSGHFNLLTTGYSDGMSKEPRGNAGLICLESGVNAR